MQNVLYHQIIILEGLNRRLLLDMMTVDEEMNMHMKKLFTYPLPDFYVPFIEKEFCRSVQKLMMTLINRKMK